MVHNVERELKATLPTHMPSCSDSDSDGEFIVGKSKKSSSTTKHKDSSSSGSTRRPKRAASSRARVIKYTEVRRQMNSPRMFEEVVLWTTVTWSFLEVINLSCFDLNLKYMQWHFCENLSVATFICHQDLVVALKITGHKLQNRTTLWRRKGHVLWPAAATASFLN